MQLSAQKDGETNLEQRDRHTAVNVLARSALKGTYVCGAFMQCFFCNNDKLGPSLPLHSVAWYISVEPLVVFLTSPFGSSSTLWARYKSIRRRVIKS